MSSSPQPVTLDAIVALCKRRGFVYPTADIYGGLNGVYDFGHLGTLMKRNIQTAWLNSLQQSGQEILQFDGALLGPESVWKASGHVDNFHDPMIDCTNCKKRYRADDIDTSKACPHCGSKGTWTDVRQFHLMFKTQLGATAEQSSVAYLRPETAQTIFANFKNIITTNRVKIPFGVAQIGKAFRNEITPKQFLFRVREFEQMELEFFCKPTESDSFFEYWTAQRKAFFAAIGINLDHIRIRPHATQELAHYSKSTNDVEYEFPFGWKELEGIAHRGDFDLTQHTEHAKKDLKIFDEETQESYMPHVVECSIGVGRLFLALLFDAYAEDVVEGEPRVVLKLHPKIAPVTAAILPLVKKIAEPAERIYHDLKKRDLSVVFDEAGSIGKRYRRQDEIGTPWCFTYDFESESTNTVTVRHRDTLVQERIAIDQIATYLKDMVKS
jgi:glycyl-tRNA synthetase